MAITFVRKVSVSGGTVLRAANNLGDVASAQTSRTNLGLGTSGATGTGGPVLSVSPTLTDTVIVGTELGSDTPTVQIHNLSTDKPTIGFYRGTTLRSVLRLHADNDFRLLASNLTAFSGFKCGDLTGSGNAAFGTGAAAANTATVQVHNFMDDKPMVGFYRGGTLRSVLRLNTDNDFRFLSSDLTTASAVQTGNITVNGTSAVAGIRTATAALDFGSISAAASADLTITVTGAAVNDSVSLGLPAEPTAGIIFQAFVSATNTVTVRATNITGSPIDPASATYRATVISF